MNLQKRKTFCPLQSDWLGNPLWSSLFATFLPLRGHGESPLDLCHTDSFRGGSFLGGCYCSRNRAQLDWEFDHQCKLGSFLVEWRVDDLIAAKNYGGDSWSGLLSFGCNGWAEAGARKDPQNTRLVLTTGDSGPDDSYSSVSFGKSFAFLLYLEGFVGRVPFMKFFQASIAHFSYKTMKLRTLEGTWGIFIAWPR